MITTRQYHSQLGGLFYLEAFSTELVLKNFQEEKETLSNVMERFGVYASLQVFEEDTQDYSLNEYITESIKLSY